MTFEEQIRREPANRAVLLWLGQDVGAPLKLRPWVDSGFDEGGQELFERAGADLPAQAKHSLSIYNICVHPETARIYALHRGRYTFVLRRSPAFQRAREQAETMDGTVDLSGLEPAWSNHWFEEDEDVQALLDAHSRAGQDP